MSDFIRRTLQCPECGHSAFGITNTGYIVCMQCMNSVKIVGRYGKNGKEKILKLEE